MVFFTAARRSHTPFSAPAASRAAVGLPSTASQIRRACSTRDRAVSTRGLLESRIDTRNRDQGAATRRRVELEITSLEDVAACEHGRQGRWPSLREVLDHDFAALIEPEDDPDSDVVLVLIRPSALQRVARRRRKRRGIGGAPRVLAPVSCGRASHLAQRLARRCAETEQRLHEPRFLEPVLKGKRTCDEPDF
jgi:hypothetical protein